MPPSLAVPLPPPLPTWRPSATLMVGEADLLPPDLLQSMLELALMQPLTDGQLVSSAWLQHMGDAAQVCSAWRDAVRALCTLLDRVASSCLMDPARFPDLTPWTSRGWQHKQYWLWRLAMHRRSLAREAGGYQALRELQPRRAESTGGRV